MLRLILILEKECCGVQSHSGVSIYHQKKKIYMKWVKKISSNLWVWNWSFASFYQICQLKNDEIGWKTKFKPANLLKFYLAILSSFLWFQWYVETTKGLWTLQNTFSRIRISRSMHIEAQSLGQISHFCYKSGENDTCRHL